MDTIIKPTNECTRRNFLQGLGLAVSTSWLANSETFAAQAAPASRPGTHRILSCNIRKPLEEDVKTGNGWDARKALCADVILAQRPDIICLQECVGVAMDYLRERLKDFDSYGLSNPEEAFNPANAILFSRSRYTLISAGGFWMSETPHVAGTKSWDSSRNRFVNWVQLKTRSAGREFRLWNTHLDHLGQVARENQARMVMEAAEAFPKDYPQILAGDFNAEATNPAVKLVIERGWTETHTAIHGPTDPGFTFHGFLGPKYAEKSAKAKSKGKIDWIFCRGAVKPVSAEILRDHRDGRYPSDHYFLSADVTMA